MLGLFVGIRAVIFLAAAVFEPWVGGASIIPASVQLPQATLFALIATVLLYSGRDDRRAWSLGLFILDSACTLTEPFLATVAAPSAALAFALQLRTDAFQAAMLWFFATWFPNPAKAPALARTFFIGVLLALALGVFLVLMDGYARIAQVQGGGALATIAAIVQRHHPAETDWYFTLQFLLLSPLLVLMPLKLREAGPDDRRRFAWLAGGLVAGLAPLATLAAVLTLVPSTERVLRPVWHWIGLVIAVSLTMVPLSAAYASLVQRTLELRLVVRAAIQYLFARWTITAAAAVPAVGLVLMVAGNRNRPVTELMGGSYGVSLGALAGAGVLAVAARTRVLSALDRQFFREQHDARQTLLEVVDVSMRASSLSELSQVLANAVSSAFHPSVTGTFVAAGDGCFHAQEADLPELQSSALAELVEGASTPLQVDERIHSVLSRLRDEDRAWLSATRARLLVPMKGASGHMLGVLVLGERRSELPYTRDDETLLQAVAAASGLALERLLSEDRDGAAATASRARECLECGTVLGPEDASCPCGGLLRRAAIPQIIASRLRVLQRVGAGGMGVVYRALDVHLQQVRALKLLLRTDAAVVARLRREARAMAAATHPNLAVVHGLETWNGTPILVMEFLDGGTLEDRLQRGPMPAAEMLELGLALAGAVSALHAAGVLHRDIKPSNIGFTPDGTPKLLDFGLARWQPGTTPPGGAAGQDGSTWSVTSSGHLGVRGTPAYLSPEVLRGRAPCGADDCWSLSVTLLEAVTGDNPFRAPTPAETVTRVLTSHHDIEMLVRGVPAPLQPLFEELLGTEETRPDTSAGLVERLQRATAS